MRELEQLKRKAARLSLCSKWQTRPVMGEGPATARVMLCGEAPGRFEAEQGKPFVGMAGRFLTKELEKVGLDRKRMYVTNIVKCKPPGNRKPKPAEVRESLPILLEELEIIKPKVVVLLGDTAVKALLGKSYTVSKDHGKIVRKDGRAFLITAHPSAAARFRRMRVVFEADLRALKKVLKAP